MELTNQTGIPAELQVTSIEGRRRAGVLTVKATFHIVDGRLVLDTDNPAPVLSDDEQTELGLLPNDLHIPGDIQNLLIDPSGGVKLADFGVAKALKTTGAATLTRERGKAGYLAPEQLDPDGSITASVDLFATGLVLWQALIGTHPYVERCPPGRSLRTWIPAQLKSNTRRQVVDAAPTAPAGLCDAIHHLLQPLERRTATAERVLAALEPHATPASAAELGRLASSTPLGEP